MIFKINKLSIYDLSQQILRYVFVLLILFSFFYMQDLNFTEPFYVPPIVLASASHDNLTNALRDKSGGLYSNALNAWVEVRKLGPFLQFFCRTVCLCKESKLFVHKTSCFKALQNQINHYQIKVILKGVRRTGNLRVKEGRVGLRLGLNYLTEKETSLTCTFCFPNADHVIIPQGAYPLTFDLMREHMYQA